MKIVNAYIGDLFVDRFEVEKNQTWCIIGKNGDPMDRFFNLITGRDKADRADMCHLPESIGAVSFKIQQAIYEDELKKDQTDILEQIDPGTPAGDFLEDPARHSDLISGFSMAEHLDKGYRQLSTGQARKLVLLQQFTGGYSWVVVENPYEGLDAGAREELDKAFLYLLDTGIRLVVCVYNPGDVPAWCTHVAVMRENRFCFQGTRKSAAGPLNGVFSKAGFRIPADDRADGAPAGSRGCPDPLVRLVNGWAGYQGRQVFHGVNLTVNKGDHTLITGPNGSGKSTLLQVITGDHPACYTNDLTVFGRSRGHGESIWDIKEKMGIVSSDLHRSYIVPVTARECVLSGFFDSIGLYRPCTREQSGTALDLLARIGLKEKSEVPFRQLCYADQRLVLIARALIKKPGLLILDEPTQGLDVSNRHALLAFLEKTARKRISTILYVSHRTDEFKDFFTQHLCL